MTVFVQFFGHYSDYFSTQPLSVELPDGATVRDLTEQLARRDTRLSNLAAHCRFAVGDEYAPLTHVLADGDSTAVLPPMSGG